MPDALLAVEGLTCGNGEAVVLTDVSFTLDRGETLALVAARAWAHSALHVWTVSLVSHSWADPQPDITALACDALVIFPWYKQVYMDGKWQLHPELDEAAAAARRSGSRRGAACRGQRSRRTESRRP